MLGLLFRETTILILDKEGVNEITLCSLKSLGRRVLVEVVIVVIVVLVESFDLIVNNAEHAEAVKLAVYLVHVISYALELVLHCEEAIANQIETVCLNQRPLLNDFSLVLDLVVFFGDSSHSHTDACFVMDHFIEFGNFEHLLLLILVLVFLRQCVNVHI